MSQLRKLLFCSAFPMVAAFFVVLKVTWTHLSADAMMRDISAIGGSPFKSPMLSRPTPMSACPSITARTSLAVVSMLSMEGAPSDTPMYIESAIQLAMGINRLNQIDLILMVVDTKKRLSPLAARTLARRSGWNICRVPAIDGPASNHHITNRFLDAKMYSKLHVWSFVEYELALFLDLDTMVIRPLEPVFGKLSQLSPAPIAMGYDKFPHNASSTTGFNAGVMLVRPNATLFRELTASISTLEHDPSMAEQNYLNAFFRGRVRPLPFAFNAMVSVKHDLPHFWNSHWQSMVILHYTCKPWNYANCIRDDIVDLCLLWHANKQVLAADLNI